MVQAPLWIPETMNGTKPYTYYIFPYKYYDSPMIKFNL